MRVRDERALLDGWDEAIRLPAWRRPLKLAASLDDGPPPEDQPVGEVVGRLLQLVNAWFTDSVQGLEGVVGCPACGERLEVRLPVDGLLSTAPATPAPPSFHVAGDGWQATVRLPTPADLAAASSAPSVAAARQQLLARLTIGIEPADALDDPAAAEVIESAMEVRDPLGALTVSVTCPSCGVADRAFVDLAAWWWTLAEARVQRILLDVHRLAQAYGWSEGQVLEVSPVRRAQYLDLLS